MPNMNPEEARRRLSEQRIARLATVAGDGQPHLVAFVFAVGGNRIFHAVDHKPKTTMALRRLSNIRENPHVSVLVDHYEEQWERLWWVRADGLASIIEEEEGRQEPVRLLVEKYMQYRETPPQGPVVAVEVQRWVGWTYSEPGGGTSTT